MKQMYSLIFKSGVEHKKGVSPWQLSICLAQPPAQHRSAYNIKHTNNSTNRPPHETAYRYARSPIDPEV